MPSARQRIMHGALSRLGQRTRHHMPLHDPPLDAMIHVVTPENIAFEYRLAGPFRRLPAFFLDLCIQITVLIGLAILLSFTVGLASPGLAMFLIFVMALVIWWFYGALFETFFN